MKSEYEKQANDFMSKTGTTLKTRFVSHSPYFYEDKEKRDVFMCTLERNGKSYTFKFGMSLAKVNKVAPSNYEILVCLQKYEVGTFDDFVSDFGYQITDTKSYHSIMDIYNKVCDEYSNVCRLFSDVMDELYEIQ